MSSVRDRAVAKEVRAFVAAVAQGVTQRGPTAWRAYFADTPSFYMVSEGRLVFDSSDAATRGIQELPKSIARIELHWESDLRIDPLTATLACVGAPYRERVVDLAGKEIVEEGYFTALAQRVSSGWRFRNAHWSVARAPSKVPK